MANDSAELFVAGDGHIYVAPFGTTMPEEIGDTLDAEFEDLGYLTTDGFRMTPALSVVDLEVWQSMLPARTIVQSRSLTLALDFAQSNEAIFQIYFGGGTFTGTVYTPPDASEVDERSLVADVFDGTREWRFMFPKVTLADAREVSFNRSSMAQWGVDLRVLAVGTDPPFTFDRTDAEFYPGD